MVGRNAPCPCGSGKKYKRCCLNTNESFLERQVAEELKQVLVDAYEQSANKEDLVEFRQYMQDWKEKLSDHWQKQRIEEAISAYYLFVKRSDLWRRQLERSLQETLRTSVRTVLEAWENPVVLLGKVKGEQNGMLEVEQKFGGELYFLKKADRMPSDPDTYVYGIVLPDHRLHPRGVYVISSLMFTRDEKGILEEEISALKKSSGIEEAAEFFKAHMVNIYEIFLGKSLLPDGATTADRKVEQAEEKKEENLQPTALENDSDNAVLEALTPIQEEAVALLDETLKARDVEFEALSRVKKVCETYLLEQQPNFRKANVVAAGVFRAAVDSKLLEEKPMTNNAVATLFDVSPASMTRHAEAVRDIISTLYEEVAADR